MSHQDSDRDILKNLGYSQELDRHMGAFSNFAISFSIICILAGGITSFHLGFSAIGGAAMGIAWPIACTFSLIVALTMGQLASAFPTAGGLYHWASILGGRGFGWLTAWLNLAGLITVLAAINVGTFLFVAGSLESVAGFRWDLLPPSQQFLLQGFGVTVITLSQSLFNHLGIRLTTRLTDFSGYLILITSGLLTVALLYLSDHLDWTRLYTFSNFSGGPGGEVWPANDNMAYLFALSLILPAYTITGFDASAHTSEETKMAPIAVPKGIVRSVIMASLAGWILVCAIVLAMPTIDGAAAKGPGVFFWVLKNTLPDGMSIVLLAAIALAQYLCGLATVTSASRMMFAFARDGGLPASESLRRVSPKYLTPAHAIWTVSALALGFTLYTPVYSTITAVCVIFLYLSYVLPVGLGIWTYGRTWTTFGPWTLGSWYRPLSILAVAGCLGLIWIGVQPPNDQAVAIIGLVGVLMAAVWYAFERKRFKGPPISVRKST